MDNLILLALIVLAAVLVGSTWVCYPFGMYLSPVLCNTSLSIGPLYSDFTNPHNKSQQIEVVKNSKYIILFTQVKDSLYQIWTSDNESIGLLRGGGKQNLWRDFHCTWFLLYKNRNRGKWGFFVCKAVNPQKLKLYEDKAACVLRISWGCTHLARVCSFQHRRG